MSIAGICASLKNAFAMRSAVLVSCGLLVTLYLLSIFCSAWFYGSSVAVSLRYAELGVFWGGDRHRRNNYLYNSGIWPQHPDVHFAGMPFPNERWSFYGPYVDGIRRRLHFNGPLNAFGFCLPAFRSQDDGASIVLPTGWLLSLPLLLLFLHARCRPHSAGHCESCGYRVCATPSTRCPECGRPVA
jgi:hypothetical protein